MPFTTPELMETDLDADTIGVLLGLEVTEGEEEPEATSEPFESALAQVSSLITSKTGVEPEDDANENDPILIGIANKLIIWNMTGRQSNVSEQEMKRRESAYLKALEMLDDYEAPSEDDPTDAAFGVDEPRVENW